MHIRSFGSHHKHDSYSYSSHLVHRYLMRLHLILTVGLQMIQPRPLIVTSSWNVVVVLSQFLVYFKIVAVVLKLNLLILSHDSLRCGRNRKDICIKFHLYKWKREREREMYTFTTKIGACTHNELENLSLQSPMHLSRRRTDTTVQLYIVRLVSRNTIGAVIKLTTFQTCIMCDLRLITTKDVWHITQNSLIDVHLRGTVFVTYTCLLKIDLTFWFIDHRHTHTYDQKYSFKSLITNICLWFGLNFTCHFSRWQRLDHRSEGGT